VPDTPFKAMGREKRPLKWWEPNEPRFGVPCEKCGGIIYEGSWPWCAGDPKGHER
jgi:hypothetical protein